MDHVHPYPEPASGIPELYVIRVWVVVRVTTCIRSPATTKKRKKCIHLAKIVPRIAVIASIFTGKWHKVKFVFKIKCTYV